MKNKTELIRIGSFELTTPEMLVTDPCYKPGTWCMGELTDCVTGKWDAYILVSDEGIWGKRVKKIIVRAESARPSVKSVLRYVWACPNGFDRLKAKIGVDSGQCGFFDKQNYQRDDSVDLDNITYDFSGWDDSSDFYKACCDCTLSERQGGVIPYGAVSSSGYGDGCYSCGFHRDGNGNTDMAFVSFI